MTSPYAILGIDHSADVTAAKAAFRAVAKTCHPDVNPDPAARERFVAAQKAYRAITLGAAMVDKPGPDWRGNARTGQMVEIDIAVSVWIAARGGSVKGSCPLGKASVRIPAGARTGDRVITKIGKQDVACIVRVSDSDGFIADGGDISAPLRLSAAQARLGAATEIETPAGWLRIKVPKNTPNGARLKVEGKGLPAGLSPAPASGADSDLVGPVRRSAGNLYLDVEIVETATDRAVAALDRILSMARRPRDASTSGKAA